jgi:Bacterial Ig domain
VRTRHQALVALTALAVLAGVAMPAFSGATFTSTSSSAATVRAAADWTPPVVRLTPPTESDPFGDEGYLLIGTVQLHASAADGESGIDELSIEVRGAATGTWVTVCTVDGSPATCGWDTTRVADGPYKVRARATDGAGYTTASAVSTTTVRNQVSVRLAPLPAYVRGAVPVTATVTGTGSSAYPVEIQYRSVGSTGPWATVCAAASCTWQTGGLGTGGYEVRARVVVNGSTIATSPVVTTVVDNAAPQVVLNDPGTPLSGTVTLAATATDPHSGIGSVTLYAQRTGASEPTSLCAFSSAPYSCMYDTRQLPNGTYSFWAAAKDRAGNEVTSPVRTNRLVDNVVQTALRGLDVQAVNGGGKPGFIDQGDVIIYDFNQPVSYGSVLAGWTGAVRRVSVQVGEGATNQDDLLRVLTDGQPLQLGHLNLNANHLPGNGKQLVFAATMTAEQVTGSVGPFTRVTVTVGAPTESHSSQKTVGAATLVWTPSGSVSTPDARDIVPDPVQESGVADRDF